MSADNFVLVRKFADGWRWAMGSASCDDELQDSEFKSKTFDDPWDASEDAEQEIGFIEYGVEIERPRSVSE
jgi:hypothetical protein